VNLILFGPPGAGKGTQAQFIVKNYNYFQLSTGDLLREEIKNKTQLGNKIDKIISKGDFVSDEIVNTLLQKSITNLKFRDRIIFDGYPRNILQAENLNKILLGFTQKIEVIIFLNVPRDIIKKRIMGRMTCEKCNMVLNEFFNTEEIELHPCGSNFLKKRKDDNYDTIMSRFDTYTEITKPVLDFYSKKEGFHEIDGSLKIEEITRKIRQILDV
jgi:adenylate kinase